MRASGLALLLVVLLASPALADHVYTHRYVVSGRVVGADGAPLAGVRVEALVDGISSAKGDCRAYPIEVRNAVMRIADANLTNEFGDFEACAHAHDLTARTPVRLRVGAGAWRNLTVDPGIRMSFASMTAEGNGTEVNASWNSTLLLRVRVWRPSPAPIVLDRVPALGEALAGWKVQADIPGTGRRTLTTDGYGDAAAYVPLGAVRSGAVTFSTERAPPAVVSFGPQDLRAEAILFVDADQERTGPASERQGGLVIPGLALAAAAALALAAATRRR